MIRERQNLKTGHPIVAAWRWRISQRTSLPKRLLWRIKSGTVQRTMRLFPHNSTCLNQKSYFLLKSNKMSSGCSFFLNQTCTKLKPLEFKAQKMDGTPWWCSTSSLGSTAHQRKPRAAHGWQLEASTGSAWLCRWSVDVGWFKEFLLATCPPNLRLVSTASFPMTLLPFSDNYSRYWMFAFGHVFPQQRKLMGSSAQTSSGVCRCGSQEQVPEEGSRRFRRVPVCVGVGSGGRFRRVPVFAGVGSGGNFRKVPEGSGEFQCFRRFRRVPVWFVALQPWQEQPCDCFWTPFGDDIVHMGKTTAEQECAHVVKLGIRLLLLGIPPKLILFGLLKASIFQTSDPVRAQDFGTGARFWVIRHLEGYDKVLRRNMIKIGLVAPFIVCLK